MAPDYPIPNTFDSAGWPSRLPDDGEIHLWWIDLKPSAREVASAHRLLDAEEVDRASRFKFDRHRRRFTMRRAQLKRLCAAYLGITPRQVEFALGPKGKPSLAPHLTRSLPQPLELNLSDSEDVAVVGFKVGRELGVDVECVREMRDAVPISKSFFAKAEQEIMASAPDTLRDDTFFRCWTRKEAYIKAVGEGLSLPLDSFTVTMTAREPVKFLQFVGHPGEEKHWSLSHFEPVPKVFVAVAVRQSEPSFRFFRTPSVDFE